MAVVPGLFGIVREFINDFRAVEMTSISIIFQHFEEPNHCASMTTYFI